MSDLNRFGALDMSSDDEDTPVKIPVKKATPAPVPAPKKKIDTRGRGRGRGRGDSRSRGRGGGGGRGGRGGNRRNDDDGYRGRRDGNFDAKDARREGRRREQHDNDRRTRDPHRTRQPRNGESARRGGRDPKKEGHGGIGTNAEEVAAGVAEVRGDPATGEGEEAVPAVEAEPEDPGLSMAEYQAKVLAEKRASLAALTGAPKAVRAVEQIEGEKMVRSQEGVVKTYGNNRSGGVSKKKKKGFVSADKIFGIKPREQSHSSEGRGGGRGRGRGRGRGGDRGRGRGGDRGDDRRTERRAPRSAPVNINDPNDFPTLC